MPQDTTMVIHVIDFEGEKHTFKVSPTTHIERVYTDVQTKTKLPLEYIRLHFKDKFLNDKNAELTSDEGIVHDDTLVMKMHINVIDPLGERHKFEVSPQTTIKEIREKIRDGSIGISIKNQYLFYQGTELEVDDDDLSLLDLGIEHEDNLILRADWCPEGTYYGGSAWSCNDKDRKDLGFGPPSWIFKVDGKKTNGRCRGFDDANKEYKNPEGEYICAESDLGALGYRGGDMCSMRMTFEEARDFCAGMNARLCSQDELAHSCAERTGCDYDYTFIWSSTPCNPSETFGGKFTKGHLIAPGDMRKWSDRYKLQTERKWAQSSVPGNIGVGLPKTDQSIKVPHTGLTDVVSLNGDKDWIRPAGKGLRKAYLEAMLDLFRDDIKRCNPEDDEKNGNCCLPDSYEKTKMFVRCCADYGTTPICRGCPKGKTSLPGVKKSVENCFCVSKDGKNALEMDRFGLCTDKKIPLPTEIITRPPTTLKPTPPPTLPACPEKAAFKYCPPLNKGQCKGKEHCIWCPRMGKCKPSAPEDKLKGAIHVCDNADYSHCKDPEKTPSPVVPTTAAPTSLNCPEQKAWDICKKQSKGSCEKNFKNLCVYCGNTKSCKPGTDKEICSDPKKFLDCRTKAPTMAPIVTTDAPTLAPVVPTTAAPTSLNCPEQKAWDICKKQSK